MAQVAATNMVLAYNTCAQLMLFCSAATWQSNPGDTRVRSPFARAQRAAAADRAIESDGHPQRRLTGGLWLRRTLVPSGLRAVVVPSGFRVTVQPMPGVVMPRR